LAAGRFATFILCFFLALTQLTQAQSTRTSDLAEFVKALGELDKVQAAAALLSAIPSLYQRQQGVISDDLGEKSGRLLSAVFGLAGVETNEEAFIKLSEDVLRNTRNRQRIVDAFEARNFGELGAMDTATFEFPAVNDEEIRFKTANTQPPTPTPDSVGVWNITSNGELFEARALIFREEPGNQISQVGFRCSLQRAPTMFVQPIQPGMELRVLYNSIEEYPASFNDPDWIRLQNNIVSERDTAEVIERLLAFYQQATDQGNASADLSDEFTYDPQGHSFSYPIDGFPQLVQKMKEACPTRSPQQTALAPTSPSECSPTKGGDAQCICRLNQMKPFLQNVEEASFILNLLSMNDEQARATITRDARTPFLTQTSTLRSRITSAYQAAKRCNPSGKCVLCN
jgi:hypothetical protein